MKKLQKLILLGDIGGTKARFALFAPESKKLSEITIFQNKNFFSFEELLKTYLENLDHEKRPTYALFAVAGPVIKDKAKLTNLNWLIRKKELKKVFSFEKLFLVNDLQALAGSFFLLKERDILILKEGRPLKKYPVAFMALGTGLGISLLVKRKPLFILPSEGGHTPFGPLEIDEEGFIKFLLHKEKELTWEEVLSGRALSHWYEYFYQVNLTPEEITEKARKGDIKAIRVIQKILQLLGRKCYEIVVTFEPFGGIFLAGGLTLALIPFLKEPTFKERFFQGYYYSTKLRGLLEVIPLYVILHPYPGLLGAQTIVHNLLK